MDAHCPLFSLVDTLKKVDVYTPKDRKIGHAAFKGKKEARRFFVPVTLFPYQVISALKTAVFLARNLKRE